MYTADVPNAFDADGFRHTGDLTGEMTLADDMSDPRSATNPAEAEEMAKYGIALVPVDYFLYKRFRYTNLEDALAQAKRDRQRTD